MTEGEHKRLAASHGQERPAATGPVPGRHGGRFLDRTLPSWSG
ncbi:hypothetical protein [Methylobacterium oryzihabitans]|nr:hypothetical protein [Methylobacterium oryzihabitans]